MPNVLFSVKSVREYFPFVVREVAVWEEVAVEVVETGLMLDPLVWVSACDNSEPSFCKGYQSIRILLHFPLGPYYQGFLPSTSWGRGKL